MHTSLMIALEVFNDRVKVRLTHDKTDTDGIKVPECPIYKASF